MSSRRRRFAGWAPAVSAYSGRRTGRAHLLVLVGRRRPRLAAACAARCTFDAGAWPDPETCHQQTGVRPCATCMQITTEGR